ncbi:MAG: hypothetical protein Q9227_000772 [Pyrenula ochraceoflavens]
MRSIGALKLSLSSFSSIYLWRQSGRLADPEEADSQKQVNKELFHIKDRSGAPLLLSPTHEEDITKLVSDITHSYKNLPLRLYQVGRKYRDELRPRRGLLRGREFMMKDLYTFDLDEERASATYEDVRDAYDGFFEDLKLPVLVATADSGNMGGNTSHEYHLANPDGEDTLFRCPSCGITWNEEFNATKDTKYEQVSIEVKKAKNSRKGNELPRLSSLSEVRWHGITKDRRGWITAFCPAVVDSKRVEPDINQYIVKAALPQVDLGITHPLHLFWQSVENTARDQPRSRYLLFDSLIPPNRQQELIDEAALEDSPGQPIKFNNITVVRPASGQPPMALKAPRAGDPCPSCGSQEGGGIERHKAIELAHTFMLGDKYSRAFDLRITLPMRTVSEEAAAAAESMPNSGEKQSPTKSTTIYPEMGCHGIGISRLIAATASHFSDSSGLNWPRAIAPFDVVVIGRRGNERSDLDCEVYDAVATGTPSSRPSQTEHDAFKGEIDVVLDDRDRDIRFKMRDANEIGFPVMVVVGKTWDEREEVEVSCKKLGFIGEVKLKNLRRVIEDLLKDL